MNRKCLHASHFISLALFMFAASTADLNSTAAIPICVPPGPMSGSFTLEYHRTVDDLDLEMNEEFVLFTTDFGLAPQFASTTVTIMDNDNGEWTLQWCTWLSTRHILLAKCYGHGTCTNLPTAV